MIIGRSTFRNVQKKKSGSIGSYSSIIEIGTVEKTFDEIDTLKTIEFKPILKCFAFISFDLTLERRAVYENNMESSFATFYCRFDSQIMNETQDQIYVKYNEFYYKIHKRINVLSKNAEMGLAGVGKVELSI